LRELVFIALHIITHPSKKRDFEERQVVVYMIVSKQSCSSEVPPKWGTLYNTSIIIKEET